ncbi:MAG: DUF3486 family protein [Gemmatimonadetes bacterium]|nr:DUF3486 family protein [Gemmatimonadota bacterium]MYF79166.1 DUF3486 family protein [Chloroflexota bacterium]
MPPRSKISQLPKPLQDEILKRYDEGHTFAEIEEWLRAMGEDVGKSSIQRHHSKMLAKWREVRKIKSQAAAMMEELGKNPSIELSQVMMDLLMSGIMDAMDKGVDFTESTPVELGRLVVSMHRAEVIRERMRVYYSERIRRAADEVCKKMVGKTDQETIDYVRKKFYGLSTSRPQESE